MEITTHLTRAAEIADILYFEVHIEEALKVVAAIKAPWKEHRENSQYNFESLRSGGDTPEATSPLPGVQVLCARDCLPYDEDEFE